MGKLIIIFLVSLITSWWTVAAVRKLAIRLGIGSLPSPRKIHREFKPLLGGLGFTAGIVLTAILGSGLHLFPQSIWQSYLHFWIGLGIILITGLLDDIKSLSSYMKFAGQALAAAVLIWGGCRIQSFVGPFGGIFPLGIFAVPFTFLWILLVINATNLIDGLDGLAGGLGFIITAGFVLVAWHTGNLYVVILGLGLMGGILGFLRYNYHPASIFMGDTGSLQLGYILAFFSIEAIRLSGSHQVYFLISLVLLSIPLADSIVAFIRRLGAGKSPFQADKQHIHHRLLKLGLSHLETVWMIYLFAILYMLLAVAMAYYPGLMGLFLFIIALVTTLFLIWRLGYVETRFSYLHTIFQKEMVEQMRRRAPFHFNRVWHRVLILLSDLVMINLALYVTYWFKFHSGIIAVTEVRPLSDYFSTPVFLLLTLGWVLLFWLNNLYQMPWDVSRYDKVLRVSKVITFGILLLGIFTFDAQHPLSRNQFYSLLGYWVFMVFFVNAGRLLIIEIEKRFRLFEYAPKNTLLIGCNEISEQILQDIRVNPHLIFDVKGVVTREGNEEKCGDLPVLGSYSDLPALIHQHKIEEVIVALPEELSEDFIRIVGLCEPQQVIIKVPPGHHDILATRDASLVGHAYLRVFPENMLLWQWLVKRLMDIVLASIMIVLTLPLWLFTAIYVSLKFRKSILVRVPVVGRNGIPFQMYLFRITKQDYDYRKNPIYLGITLEYPLKDPILNFLYRYRLYKLPQLLNVLLGDMSLVGPRPEPPEWYTEYGDALRLVHRRVFVRPGFTGLAQVKYRYELSLRVLQHRIRYDIFYIDHLSLRVDIRILLRSLLMIFQRPGSERNWAEKDQGQFRK